MEIPIEVSNLLEPAASISAIQKGNQYASDTEEVEIKDFPELPEAAMYGLAGEFARFATEESEADPAAVLMTFLTFACTAFGDACFAKVGTTKHPPRLYTCITGRSGKSRKGTSLDPVLLFFDELYKQNPMLEKFRTVFGGLASGEGAISAMRDADKEPDKKEEDKDFEPPLINKRILSIESEMGKLLKVSNKDGNTLSPVLRSLWDHGRAATLTRNNPIESNGAHINILGHITYKELKSLLCQSDIFNGFSNRFLWVCARRKRLIPIPGDLDQVRLNGFIRRFAVSLETAMFRPTKGTNIFRFDEAAKAKWISEYGNLSSPVQEDISPIVDRAEPQTLRLALLLALIDGSDVIGLPHLDAALSIWSYCLKSVEYIFGRTGYDPATEKILSLLHAGPKTQTEINRHLGGHKSADELRDILSPLQDAGTINSYKLKREKGASTTYWQLTGSANACEISGFAK